MSSERLSKEEIGRRLKIVYGIPWGTYNLIFEYKPKGEEWDSLPHDERLPTRGMFIGIQPAGDSVVIRTNHCYRYQPWDGQQLPCDDLVLEIRQTEIVPDAYGDMLLLESAGMKFVVFGVNSYLFKA